MYHALLGPEPLPVNQKNPYKKKKERKKKDPRCQEVLEVITIMLNLCILHGFALDRWLTIHNAMLEKSIGNDYIEKLRVIHIFEADFNLILGILWAKRMMSNASNHKAISKYQWGGIKGRQSIEPVLMKVLSFEIAALTRTSLVEIDKDAASCYDRIVMTVSNLQDQKWGMPKSACKMLGMVLALCCNKLETNCK